MEEVKGILRKYDIAALVVLHTPGHSEYLMHVETTYSCAKYNGDLLRVKARLKDYNGNKELWTEKVTDTSNMFNLLGEVGGRISIALMDVSETVDKIVQAEHTSGDHTSHTQQNN